jgi:hypothetical protein
MVPDTPGNDIGSDVASEIFVFAVITVAIVGTLAFLAGAITSTLNSVTSKR